MTSILLDARDETSIEFSLPEFSSKTFPVAMRFRTGRSNSVILITREHLQAIHLQIRGVLAKLPEPEIKDF